MNEKQRIESGQVNPSDKKSEKDYSKYFEAVYVPPSLKDAKKRGITFEEMKQLELEEIPLSRYGYGSDMAGAVMWLASKSGEYVTGQLINVNGGLDFT